jgi:biotin carboxyl carrier protein
MASTYQVRLGDREAEVEVEEKEGGVFHLKLDGVPFPVSLQRLGESAHYSIIVGNRPYDLFAEETSHGYHIVMGPYSYAVTMLPGRVAPGAPRGLEAPEAPALAGEWVLTSPMSGVVQELHVSLGDEVRAGSVVAVIEAMKMQNELRARHAGTVKAVYVSVGQRVEQGAPLVVLL